MTHILSDYIQHQLGTGRQIATIPATTFELHCEYGDYLWDVGAAQRLAPIHGALEILDLTPLLPHVYDPDTDPEPPEPHYPVNSRHAQTTNLNKPLLLVQIQTGATHFEALIDGYHRVYKAKTRGFEELTCWVIPPHIEQELRLYHKPPTPQEAAP